jgi:hypothetical protein
MDAPKARSLVQAVIDRLGGDAVVLEALGLPARARRVDQWRRRGSIPAHYFVTLVNLAKLRGVPLTHEELEPLSSTARTWLRGRAA